MFLDGVNIGLGEVVISDSYALIHNIKIPTKCINIYSKDHTCCFTFWTKQEFEKYNDLELNKKTDILDLIDDYDIGFSTLEYGTINSRDNTEVYFTRIDTNKYIINAEIKDFDNCVLGNMKDHNNLKIEAIIDFNVVKEMALMNENKTNINWYPGHMAKTKRLIIEKEKVIDIVYELVDARIPFSSKIKNIYDVVGNKPKILIMTKKDLCDDKITNKWKIYYESLGTHVLILDLNDDKGIMELVNLTHELTKDIQEKRLSKGLKDKSIHALVVGIPNVGKSTLINRMCKRRVAVVGNNPGVTKNLSWLKTEYGIELLDTPGILWPKIDNDTVAFNLASFTAIKQEILPINDVAYYIIETLKKYYPNILDSVYHVSDRLKVVEIIDTIATNIGAIKDGEVDYNRVSNKIINDIKLENIKGITFDRK